jgi:DNA-binding NtrC family response regulator
LVACHRDGDTSHRQGTLLGVLVMRERGANIDDRAQYFLCKLNLKHHTAIRFSEEALVKIVGHPWPGNIRQLK